MCQKLQEDFIIWMSVDGLIRTRSKANSNNNKMQVDGFVVYETHVGNRAL